MTAEQLQLLTAAVDGELSDTETRALRTLLATSADARVLFERLQADRARVRKLLPAAPPSDLHARVMARVVAVPPRRLSEPARATASRRSAWLPVAAAAAVLIATSAGVVGFLAGGNPTRPSEGDLVARQGTPLDPATSTQSPPSLERPAPETHLRAPTFPAPRELRPTPAAAAPAPRPVRQDLIGSPLLPKLPPFERIDIRVPFLRSVPDLGREDVGAELLDELRRDPAFRFDLFVRDTARGVEVFQHAARAAGLSVHGDAATQEKLKKRQVLAALIYTESLTAAELVTLFAHLPGEDAKFSPRVCDALHATPVARADELDLKTVLGIDVGLFKRPIGNAPATPERPLPSRPVSADTIDSVVKSVGGTSAKGTDRAAVLLTWQPAPGAFRTPPATSAELKLYLQKRGDRKPSAVPAVIVIRPAI